MKSKDYYRLANLSLKERKNNTRSTVAGLAFGFIILLPIIVCLFGINYSFNKQINKQLYLLNYSATNMTDYRIDIDGYKNVFVSGYDNIDFFDNDKNITNKIVYETDKLIGDNENTTKYKIDNSDYKPIPKLETNYYSIIDIKKSNSYFPKNLTEKFPGGIFLNDYNQGFVSDGKKQVIMSEKMLNALQINADDIYQKNLTIASDSFTDKKNSTQKFSGYICKDYTVVGIIKNEVSALYQTRNDFMSANLFFTSVNVYDDKTPMLKPYYEEAPTITINSGSVSVSNNGYTYNNFATKEELNSEYMMLGSYGSTYSGPTFSAINIYIESDSYSNLYSSYKQSEKHINIILENNAMNPLTKSVFYERYQGVYDLIMLISSVFLVTSCIVILCSMINIYVTIKHSVKQRKYYLTMLRAIGAKDSTLTKLYMAESCIIVTKANILVTIIGFIITFVIKLIIDRALTLRNISYDFSISYSSILLCLAFIVVFLYIFAFLVSYLCTYKLSKKPIISILSQH